MKTSKTSKTSRIILIVCCSALVSLTVFCWQAARLSPSIPYSESYLSQIIPSVTSSPIKAASVSARMTPIASIDATLRIPIITYHYVEYVQNPNDAMRHKLAINPALFEQQVKALHDHNVETYFVKEIPRLLNQENELATRSAVLTFDDGYRDFYINAFPILKKYKTKGTIYIISNFLDRYDFLTRDEVAEMLKSGLIEVGSHTLDHAYLKNGQYEYVKRQILESKSDLEKLFGIQVETFAYPFGAYDDQSVNLVKEASYSAAVSTVPGVLHSSKQLFTLTRWRAGALNGIYSVDSLDHLR
ncbi:MAG: polysaccharide deacetylase family protein [Candidatus Roizmanbacteria bacterium]